MKAIGWAAVVGWVLAVEQTHAQGTFRNLDFEEANLPVLPPHHQSLSLSGTASLIVVSPWGWLITPAVTNSQ